MARGHSPEEERVADRLEDRDEDVRVVEEVADPLAALEAGQRVERLEDRREEEPGQQHRRDDVLDVAEEHVRARDDERQPGR